MIHFKPILNFFTLSLVVLLLSCSGGQKKGEQADSGVEASTPKVEINSEAKLLLKTLSEMGDYANSRNFPSLIKPSAVFEELDGNIQIIDLRSEDAFDDGHIKGAVRVSFSDLPAYFSNDIKPFEYDKIVMVCYSGQIASYATSLLRLAGYGNVYAMRWGMSAWNKYFAEDSWLDNVSSEFQDQLETAEHDKAAVTDLPKLNTGKTSGDEILQVRIDSLFAAGYSEALIHADDVFEDPAHYYTINYDRKDKYESGHIPGAVRYKPGGTLGIVSEMQTIPTDKEVVVYCNTGHNSGFATAYLRLFGYDAKTLTFGNNAFMYDKMKEEESALSWLPFTEAEIHDYPYVSN
ncbi:rhodanese-like domain-containing protein [Maribellus sediminis]|uniref:rhodanese-like domain-containing protein n=1 Tax=Maribellus sediminis TaxID=2696285 RepID=UPI0014317DE9|nr:rhodanese-like domain-containing protein [Maribellus sediminis]